MTAPPSSHGVMTPTSRGYDAAGSGTLRHRSLSAVTALLLTEAELPWSEALRGRPASSADLRYREHPARLPGSCGGETATGHRTALILPGAEPGGPGSLQRATGPCQRGGQGTNNGRNSLGLDIFSACNVKSREESVNRNLETGVHLKSLKYPNN